jgi:hypothetical protein
MAIPGNEIEQVVAEVINVIMVSRDRYILTDEQADLLVAKTFDFYNQRQGLSKQQINQNCHDLLMEVAQNLSFNGFRKYAADAEVSALQILHSKRQH